MGILAQTVIVVTQYQLFQIIIQVTRYSLLQNRVIGTTHPDSYRDQIQKSSKRYNIFPNFE